MLKAMHGLSTMHCNLRTDIRLASESGFEALELIDSKLLRYLDCGYTAGSLCDYFDRYNIKPVCINALKDVESVNPGKRKKLFDDCHRLTLAAADIGCPTIQLVPFCELEGMPYNLIMEITASNISQIARIGSDYGIRYQLEPIAWSPICSLSQCLQLIEMIGAPNVGMVIDFWHLSAGGRTNVAEVARLNKDTIYGVHFCDGFLHKDGELWDEAALRSCLPGDGELPVQEWTDAVTSTGYDGSWSSELYSPAYWEYDMLDIAILTRKNMEKYLTGKGVNDAF